MDLGTDIAGIEAYLTALIADRFRVDPARMRADTPLVDYDIDSLGDAELMLAIEETYGIDSTGLSVLRGATLADVSNQIKQRLEARETAGPAVARAEPAERRSEYPLSHGQRALWFLHQFAVGGTAYNISRAALVHGEIDAQAFGRALDALVDRHESLRTSFHQTSEGPVQRIGDRCHDTLELIDASDWSDELLAERLGDEAHRPFDLGNDALFRAVLFERSNAPWVLLLASHHIVVDYWSLAVLIDELGSLYSGERSGSAAELEPVEARYTDFVTQQADQLAGEPGERGWRFWQQQLSGSLPDLDFPTDRPRPSVQTHRGSVEMQTLEPALTEQVKALASEQSATLYMTLLAAFFVLLHRHTGQRDLLVASPTSGRRGAHFTGVVGYFMNPIVLRASLEDDPTFVDFLAQVRETSLGAFEHQDYPFSLLVEKLKPSRDAARSTLFQALFTFQSAPVLRRPDLRSFALGEPGTKLEHGELVVESMPLEQRASQFDLSLAAAELPAGLVTSLEYNVDLFDASTMRRALLHFGTLLQAIVADPQMRISELPLMTEAERAELPVDSIDQRDNSRAPACVHELIEAQASRTPDAVAVVSEGMELTYGELDARSNQLARYLQSVGVERESLVGVCVERSATMIVALLGILKAGGGYVPLDPEYPLDRLAFMRDDAGVEVVISEQAVAARIENGSARLIRMDSDRAAIESQSRSRLTGKVDHDNIAYATYTSGSTGKPNAVAIEHRNVVALIDWADGAFDAEELAGTLVSTSLCFDLSVFEIFVPLALGGKLIVVDDALALTGTPLAEQVTLINTVPSALSKLLDLTDLPAATRTVNLCGEALQRSLVTRIREQPQVRRLLNLYGPTEATVYATAVDLIDDSDDGVPPIGRPIAGWQAYILDANLEQVPIGVRGELYLGGAGLARGYLGRPQLTEERFIPHPLDPAAGRLYKTGDLARYLPDGQIDFLGRTDHQVKVRGFRIELGEVESVLDQHPGIDEVVVVAIGGGAADQQLVAYVAPAPGVSLSTEQLRDFPQGKLPGYMVPRQFVIVESLPRTLNGKIDRKALRPPEVSRSPDGESASPLERLIAERWAEVLECDHVGIHDDFFELGGHSLLAAELALKLSDALGCEVSLKQLFLFPTVAELAQSLGGTLPIEPVGGADTARPSPVGRSGEGPPQPSEFLSFEPWPLPLLFETGELAPVDAAAIGCFPGALLTGTDAGQKLQDLTGGLPVVTNVLDLSQGRIALVALPLLDRDVYSDRARLVELLLPALELAGSLGARSASLTGLIPSATDYGRAVAAAAAGRAGLPAVSTGHATTTGAVVLAIERILRETGRSLPAERVAFLGLGSVGLGTLRLMLSVLPHPAEITVCDAYGKQDLVEAVERELAEEFGFRGELRPLTSRGDAPAEVYEATLIVGATNVADILDVARLAPGTLLVDDSAPHCFPAMRAIERFEQARDIVLTEGGFLRAPAPISELRYAPQGVEQLLGTSQGWLPSPVTPWASLHDPRQITGCVLSGLLDASFEDLEPTLGPVDLASCVRHREALRELGFDSANLHCEGHRLDEGIIEAFGRRFGGTAMDAAA